MTDSQKNSAFIGQNAKQLLFSDFQQRLRWYIRLRWSAAAAFLVVVLVFGFALPVITMPRTTLGVAVLILCFNAVFYLFNRHLQNCRTDPRWLGWAIGFSHVQTIADLLSIAILLHLTGGVENPFALFFLFHVIATSLLLGERTSLAYAALAAMLYALVVWGEFFSLGPLRHHPLNFGFFLSGSGQLDLWRNPLYVFAASAAVTSAVFVCNYLGRWLGRLLHRREEQLAQAYEHLSDAVRARTQYLLRVTHELRSPLATIRNCLALAIEPPAGTSTQKQSQMLARAHKRTDSLLDLVNDLLDLARIQSGQCDTEAEQVDLTALVRDACAFLQPRIDSENQKLLIELEDSIPTVYACRHLLGQMVMNLLSNAQRYTPQGGTIKVSCRRNSQHITIQVSDTGIGISPSERPHVFSEFFRGKNARKKSATGTGLGLPIVRQAVEQCDGSIELSHNRPEGTVATVCLPIKLLTGSLK